MSTVDQYAASTVEKYHVAADTESRSHRAVDEVIPLIKQWGKQFLADIKLSGVYAKNTAVSLSCDVDVLVTLNPVPGKEIKNIFWSLSEYLSNQDLRPETQRVSIQVQALKMKVDLIPSYPHRGGCILFNKKTRAEVHTDLTQHVHLIGNSGRQQEICALKIWRERNRLDFLSLYLELTVLQALASEPYGQLPHNVLTVPRYLGSRFRKDAGTRSCQPGQHRFQRPFRARKTHDCQGRPRCDLRRELEENSLVGKRSSVRCRIPRPKT